MLPIRARDLRDNVKVYGFERGMLITLEAILDERVQEREHIRELTDLVARCIDQVERMINVGDAMSHKMQDIERIRQQGDQHDPGSIPPRD